MTFFDVLFRARRRSSYRRALAHEHARRARLAPPDPQTIFDRAAAELAAGSTAVPFGTLPDHSPLQVDDRIALMSALVSGATGSGKTRFLLGFLFSYIDRMLGPSADLRTPDLELELIDPKHETFDLFAQHLAALWLTADDAARHRIAIAVRVIDWSREAIAPMAPFDNAAGEVSNAYLAYIRTDVAVQASPQSFSEPLRQAYFMLNRVLVDLRFPPNYAFSARFLSDDAYRARILAKLADADVRAFFEHVEHTLPRQTREALLRRIQADLAFEEVRLSTGVPPADLDQLLPRRHSPITIGNYGCSLALPLAKAKERASYRLIDVLMAAPRRNPSSRGLVVIDEAPMLLSGSSELAEPLMEGARTLRSVGMGLVFASQDFSHALPTAVVRTLQLNTRWWALFQSREDAEWIYPHVVSPAHERELSDRERHRAFTRRMSGLRRQHFYLHVKGHPALPLVAPSVPDPSEASGRPADELREVFWREIASRSLIPAAVAAERIARWESAVLGREEIVPSQKSHSAPRRRASGLRELVEQLEGEEDAGE
jgi:hypothetical protein